MKDGETQQVQSTNTKSASIYAIKRTGNTYSCSCPAWRNQKGVSVDARTCKHLKQVLGEEFEKERISSVGRDSKGSNMAGKGNCAVESGKGNENGKKRKAESKKRDQSPKKQPRSGTSQNPLIGPDDEETIAEKHASDDLLSCINGIKPSVLLSIGETREIKSSTSDTTYTIKRVDNHYYCTCPSWRNQSGPVDSKTCKHLRSLLGDLYESARTSSVPKLPSASNPTSKGIGLLLAEKWDMNSDPTGYWLSEKLDGVRAHWNGKAFLSREGNRFFAPEWFTRDLPDLKLDGELYCGRGCFQDTVSIVRTSLALGAEGEKWRKVTYKVFDIVDLETPFEERISQLQRLFATNPSWISVLDHEKCRSRDHLKHKLESVVTEGGEGLMLREPKSLYIPTRSKTLYKVKTFYDAEAVVIGYEAGKGRNKGVCGALKCRMESGKEFKIGTGLNDAVRLNPPKIGAIVNYKFQELSRSGVPRFPSFVGERVDMSEAKDAVIPVAIGAGE